jgi:hypothetical protein
LASPSREEGALAIVTNVGAGSGGRGSVVAQGCCRAGYPLSEAREQSTSASTNGADAYGKTVWSWHPLLVSSRRRFFKPNRVLIILQSADDGDKTNSSPGRALHKP